MKPRVFAAAVVACGLASLPVETAAATLPLLEAASKSTRINEWKSNASSCPEAASVCVPLVIYVPAGLDDRPADRAWLADQLVQANRLFAASGIGFIRAQLLARPEDAGDVDTREQRDALRNAGLHAGAVTIFIVDRLGDVDVEGAQIRGVHWRVRNQPDDHFVILSRISSPLVLAHELGHYFGLPHSRAAASIINKTPRDQPPLEERGFVAVERRKIAQTLRVYLEEKALLNLAKYRKKSG